ncbi:MAG: phosphomannomutase [Psychrobacter sp.]|uniref:phosphomannomutase n=1 Tax=Psychrobacter sp. AOP7-B1-24 TaxID=3457645 RepID=UPI003FB8E2E2
MPSFAAQQSLFRAYDIRGSRQYFTTDFIQALGHAFAHRYSTLPVFSDHTFSNDACAHNTELKDISSTNSLITQNQNNKDTIIVIGYDTRIGSDMIAQKIASILAHHDLQVVQLGLVTTPMMVFWAEQYQGHGIIVTASHSAKEILGIKWLVNHRSPSSAEIQLFYQQLLHRQQASIDAEYNCAMQANGLKNHPQDTCLPAEQVATTYIASIDQVFQKIHQSRQQRSNKRLSKNNNQLFTKLDFRVIIDCMHGATSIIAQRLFAHFCQDVIMLNDTPDGNFPSGSPDPTEPHRLKQLQYSVRQHQADIGLAFDGDGDRLMIVDNNGKVVSPDHLLYLLAQLTLAEHPDMLSPKISVDSPFKPQIVFDIKCSHHLSTLLSELGATPIISRTGSSFMRQQLQYSAGEIVFAGELSGHFIFNDSRFIVYDDGMYAALRLLHWLAANGAGHGKKSLTDMTDELPAMVSTADHYLPLPKTLRTEYSIVEQLSQFCRYLRQLLKATSADSEQHLINTNSLVDCHCSVIEPHLTLKQARELMPVGTTLSCIDGVRLDFAHGFGVLRQSNTSHHLTARFAGDSIDELKAVQEKFATLCRPFDKDLAAQIVAIPAE